MRLSLLRSLLRQPARSVSARLEALACGQTYAGAEVSLSQLESAPILPQDLRLVCRLAPTDADDAARQFDRLAAQMGRGSPPPVDLVLLDAPPAGVADTLQYLVDVAPHAVDFLEAHPAVGRGMQRMNAHGKPVQDHASGVCHVLGGGVESLAEILDVLPPTRLSLNCSNVWTLEADEAVSSPLAQGSPEGTATPVVADWDAARWVDELDAVVLGTDHLCASTADPSGAALYWEEIWSVQIGRAHV